MEVRSPSAEGAAGGVMGKMLAVETSTDWLSVALLDGEEVLAFEEHGQSRQHASVLLPTIDRLLTEVGLGLDDLASIALSVGPGSFTSLRIGLATVKGLAFGRSLSAIGVSTLEAMALASLEAGEDGSSGEVVAMLDARRGEWYAGGWTSAAKTGGLPAATLPEGLYAADRLGEWLSPSARVMTPDVDLWRSACAEMGSVAPDNEMADVSISRPRADAVGRLATRRLARGEAIPVAHLEARYLRRAEAEAKRMGSPVEAGEVAHLTRSSADG